MQPLSLAQAARRPGAALRFACAAAAMLAGSSAALADDPAQKLDLTQLPIENLLDLEVYSASKFAQKISEAPSAVTVVTAAEIKAYGWRTLADILRSMRGLYVTYDRNYHYLGARGFLRPGDYSSRFLLLVNGTRTNDAVYDQASIGTEFVLDVDDIERVEYVPGPGSSIYGANALFGVINVISKRGRDLAGARATLEAGSFGAGKAHLSYGTRRDDGFELMLSASAFSVRGEDPYFPEFDNPPSSNGVAHRLDYDRGRKALAQAALGPFSLSLAHAERKKGIPTASFAQEFDAPGAYTLDTQTFLDAGYRRALGERSELSARVYWGRYDYAGDYIYHDGARYINRDGAHARWWGAELKLVSTALAGHKLVAGLEAQRDERKDQYSFYSDSAGVALGGPALDDRRSGRRQGLYLQDEVALHERLLLNAGVRLDQGSSIGQEWNPRLALIGKLGPATSLKAIYGSAFRAPNAYELYYQVPGAGGQKANADLKAEHIRTRELVLEHTLAADSRLTASLFRNTVADLISQSVDPQDGLLTFRNLDVAVARGLELEYEHAWRNGARLRASYSWQRALDASTDAELPNSPRHLAKLNLSAPLGPGWLGGVEAQYVGARKTLAGELGGHWIANANLVGTRLGGQLEFSAGIHNLFDRRYADPGAQEHAQDALPQSGRSFRLKLSYRY
jgi:outer membrane receptor protein involved in Fe transport